MTKQRDYDVVLFGATGFTGRLAALYLARSQGGAVRWAIAGRDDEKLARLHEELVAIDASCEDVGRIRADLDDAKSLAEMAARTRVVATTAGPFIRYGEPVLRACVEAGADYVDITGEPEYVDMTIARYDEAAEKAGVRVVSCCGFDSVPHDMGVYYTVKQLPEGVPITIEGFVRARGGMSGGTWTSAVEAMGRMREAQRAAKERRANGGPKVPRSKEPGGRRVGGTGGRIRYERNLRKWVAPMPTIDPQVVKRSARTLERYGPDFRYGHYATFKRLPMLLGTAVGLGGIFVLAQAKPTRELLFRLRPSGRGPSAEEIARGWFEVRFLADAGYGDTAKMISECALCLALDRDQTPDRAGVLTTASAMGDPLIARLERAGLTFEML
jgi:short subunit dehydrogenase-like uncharacterized protein